MASVYQSEGCRFVLRVTRMVPAKSQRGHLNLRMSERTKWDSGSVGHTAIQQVANHWTEFRVWGPLRRLRRLTSYIGTGDAMRIVDVHT